VLKVEYDAPGGTIEYRFAKTGDGWKIEGPCVWPPERQ
jgi:hypothetical protein